MHQHQAHYHDPITEACFTKKEEKNAANNGRSSSVRVRLKRKRAKSSRRGEATR